MRRVPAIVVILSLLFTLAACEQNKQASKAGKIEPLPRDLEIELALSALPPRDLLKLAKLVPHQDPSSFWE